MDVLEPLPPLFNETVSSVLIVGHWGLLVFEGLAAAESPFHMAHVSG